jgi:hypothetical protein
MNTNTNKEFLRGVYDTLQAGRLEKAQAEVLEAEAQLAISLAAVVSAWVKVDRLTRTGADEQ